MFPPPLGSFRHLNDDPRYTILNSNAAGSSVYVSTLTIPSVMVLDNGGYRCLAMNSAGGPVHATASLVVLGKCMCDFVHVYYVSYYLDYLLSLSFVTFFSLSSVL